MDRRKARKPRPPLDQEKLAELALSYVGRFATSRAKLAAYLTRKLRDRGWSGEQPADVDAIVERLSSLGYVDDAAYALSKSSALTARGYGARRVRQSLRAAGIGEEDGEEASAAADSNAVEAALRFARRRRIGPYGDGKGDRSDRERQLAAMIRAGHPFDLAKAIVAMEAGANFDVEILEEKG